VEAVHIDGGEAQVTRLAGVRAKDLV